MLDGEEMGGVCRRLRARRRVFLMGPVVWRFIMEFLDPVDGRRLKDTGGRREDGKKEVFAKPSREI